MDFLARDSVSFSDDFWNKIDKAVVDTAKKNLIGRQFLNIYGPLGPGAVSTQIDEITLTEETNDGVVKTSGRRFIEIPQLFQDFTLLWRDIESSEKSGYPLDLSTVMLAAQEMVKKEDNLVFFGNEFLGTGGLLNTEGVTKVKRSDWTTGESAFTDIASGLSTFRSKGLIGNYSLIVSSDLFVDLQRIQPALGILEADRISNMLHGRLFNAPVLGKNKAVLVCSEPQYMDLVIGKDMETGYLETKDLNHVFRIIETLALRIKCKDAVIVFE